MSEDLILSNHSFTSGLVRVNLIHGDILSCPTDIVICPVDQKGTTRSGLFGVFQEKGAFEGNPMGSKKWLAIGDSMLVSVKNLPFEKLILLSLFSESLGNANRTAVQSGLVKALKTADAEGAVTITCPMLGHAKSKIDYAIIAGVMLKGVMEFASGEPASVRRIVVCAYNKTAFLAGEAQILGFNQGQS